MGNIVFNICGVLILLAAGQVKGQRAVQKFYTEERAFIRLANDSRFGYGYWEQECRKLGEGWFPAVIYSPAEFKIIRLFITRRHNVPQFWLGGSSTSSGPRGSIEFFEYQTTSTGNRRVFIDTDWGGFKLPSNYYDLKVRFKGGLPNVLCGTDGLSFNSDSSLYQKLVSSTPQNRSYWINKCSEIGRGWIPVILNSEAEFDLITENQRSFSNSQSYWISGSTRGSGSIDFLHYLPYEIGTGIRPVYVSTEGDGTHDNENFQLTAGDETLMLHGVLCENDGLIYHSETSQYRRLTSAVKLNYPTSAQRCFELGAGWAPAVADDIDELEYIQAHEAFSTDFRDYWIGGLAYNDILEDTQA